MIKRLEKFFGVDLDYIFRGGFWLGLDQAVSWIVGLGLSVAFANLLPPTTYGVYRYTLSFFAIFTIATLPNMSVAVVSFVARGLEGLLTRALRTRMCWGLLGSASAIILAGYYFFHHNATLGFAFALMALVLPFVDPFNLYSAYLRGKKLFRINAQYNIIIRLFSAAAVVAALFLTNNLLWILASFFFPYILLRPLIYFVVVKGHPPNNKIDNNMINYGKHLSILQFLGAMVDYLDSLLIFHYLGAVPLAIFTVAASPVNKVRQAFSVITELALPKFSARDPKEVRRTLLKRILRAMPLIVAGVLSYIFITPLVFSILFPQYQESTAYSQVLALGLFTLPFGLLYTFFQARAMKQKIYQYKIATMLAQLVIVLIMVPVFGIIGAVIARLALRLFGLGTLLLLYGRGER